LTEAQKSLFAFYEEVRAARSSLSLKVLRNLWDKYQGFAQPTWLLGVEILELAARLNEDVLVKDITHLLLERFPDKADEIKDGLRLAFLP
jgi:hypothetical protein